MVYVSADIENKKYKSMSTQAAENAYITDIFNMGRITM